MLKGHLPAGLGTRQCCAHAAGVLLVQKPGKDLRLEGMMSTEVCADMLLTGRHKEELKPAESSRSQQLIFCQDASFTGAMHAKDVSSFMS